MKKPILREELNKTVADFLIGCGEENFMCVYAGFYIKSLEAKIQKLEKEMKSIIDEGQKVEEAQA